jgi:hypothetical protein
MAMLAFSIVCLGERTTLTRAIWWAIQRQANANAKPLMIRLGF